MTEGSFCALAKVTPLRRAKNKTKLILLGRGEHPRFFYFVPAEETPSVFCFAKSSSLREGAKLTSIGNRIKSCLPREEGGTRSVTEGVALKQAKRLRYSSFSAWEPLSHNLRLRLRGAYIASPFRRGGCDCREQTERLNEIFFRKQLFSAG